MGKKLNIKILWVIFGLKINVKFGNLYEKIKN
jgi:hypothetical protein